MREYEIERGQLDVGPTSDARSRRARREKDPPDDQLPADEAPDDQNGVYWRSTMIDADTRLHAGRGIAKSSGGGLRGGFSDASAEPRTSGQAVPDDQRRLGRIREAIVQAWGKVPEYKGRGRPPEKRRTLGGWKCLQGIKERDGAGRVTGRRKTPSFGEEESLLELFEEHTAHVEQPPLRTGR